MLILFASTLFNAMFRRFRLNTDISNWDVNNVKLFRDTFDGALIEDKYKPNFQ